MCSSMYNELPSQIKSGTKSKFASSLGKYLVSPYGLEKVTNRWHNSQGVLHDILGQVFYSNQSPKPNLVPFFPSLLCHKFYIAGTSPLRHDTRRKVVLAPIPPHMRLQVPMASAPAGLSPEHHTTSVTNWSDCMKMTFKSNQIKLHLFQKNVSWWMYCLQPVQATTTSKHTDVFLWGIYNPFSYILGHFENMDYDIKIWTCQ